MRTLGVNINSTTTLFDRIRYPGGEIQTRLNRENADYILQSASEVNKDHGPIRIELTAYIQNSDDIIMMMQVCDIMRNLFPDKNHEINLHIPYLPYARADRRFGGPSDTLGLKVFLSLLGSMKKEYSLNMISTLDAHPVGQRLRDLTSVGTEFPFEIVNIPPTRYITSAIVHMLKFEKQISFSPDEISEINILFPDKGARMRYADLFNEEIKLSSNVGQIQVNILHCEKDRDPMTGKLNGFVVPEKEEFNSGPILIVDDICDGGGTFIGIADKLFREKHIYNTPYLYVTHGIFSNGTAELYQRFEKIYTTNSFYGQKNNKDEFQHFIVQVN